jgi:hypothetical protein
MVLPNTPAGMQHIGVRRIAIQWPMEVPFSQATVRLCKKQDECSTYCARWRLFGVCVAVFGSILHCIDLVQHNSPCS